MGLLEGVATFVAGTQFWWFNLPCSGGKQSHYKFSTSLKWNPWTVDIKIIKHFRGKLIAVQNSFIWKRVSLLLQENQQKVHKRGQPMMVSLKDRDVDPSDNGLSRNITLWRFIWRAMLTRLHCWCLKYLRRHPTTVTDVTEILTSNKPLVCSELLGSPVWVDKLEK